MRDNLIIILTNGEQLKFNNISEFDDTEFNITFVDEYGCNVTINPYNIVGYIESHELPDEIAE